MKERTATMIAFRRYLEASQAVAWAEAGYVKATSMRKAREHRDAMRRAWIEAKGEEQQMP